MEKKVYSFQKLWEFLLLIFVATLWKRHSKDKTPSGKVSNYLHNNSG